MVIIQASQEKGNPLSVLPSNQETARTLHLTPLKKMSLNMVKSTPHFQTEFKISFFVDKYIEGMDLIYSFDTYDRAR